MKAIENIQGFRFSDSEDMMCEEKVICYNEMCLGQEFSWLLSFLC